MAARTRAPLGLFCVLALVLSLSPATASRSLLDAAAAAAAAAATASQQASIAAAAASGQYTPSQASQAAAASAASGAAQQQTIASGGTPATPATPVAQGPGSSTPSVPESVPAQECKRTLIWTPGDYGNALLAPVLQDASLFGVKGCAESGLVPRCCNGPEASTITYPYGFSCISDTSGSAYGGQCPQQTPDFNHFFASACCPQ